MARNTTCIATTEGVNELLNNVNIYVLLLQGAAITMIEVLGAVMNIFVMIVILANKELHTRLFILSLQIVIMNIIISLCYTPSALTGLYREWLFGETFCIIYGAASFFVATWRWPVMFLLILDRFLTVFCPFYCRLMSKYVMIPLSMGAFLISLLASMIPLFDIGVGCYTFIETHLTCKVSWQCTNVGCLIYSYTFYMVIFTFGGIAPVIMYIAMYIKGRKMRQTLMSLPVVIQNDGRSPMLALEQKSENRAKITVLVMFISLICLCLPYFIGLIVFRSDTRPDTVNNIPVSIIAIIQYVLRDIYYCLPISDAVIILRNKEIKSAVKKMTIFRKTYLSKQARQH